MCVEGACILRGIPRRVPSRAWDHPTCPKRVASSPHPSFASPFLSPPAGVLAGAVSITAGCALVQSYAAVIIGCIGAFIYSSTSRMLLK